MGFKLPGKSIQSGTSGHSSALKMVAEQRAASALKMKASPAKSPEYDKAAKNDSELGNYVAERTRIKKSYGGDRKKYRASEEYKANQSKINKAYGIDDGYTAPAETKTETKVISPGNGDPQESLNNSIKSKETETVKVLTKKQLKKQAKDSRKKSEIDENAKVRDARDTKKKTKLDKDKGRGEKNEYAYAKLKESEAKGEDLAGAGGGKRAKLFGNIRRKLNKNKTAKLKKNVKFLNDHNVIGPPVTRHKTKEDYKKSDEQQARIEAEDKASGYTSDHSVTGAEMKTLKAENQARLIKERDAKNKEKGEK